MTGYRKKSKSKGWNPEYEVQGGNIEAEEKQECWKPLRLKPLTK